MHSQLELPYVDGAPATAPAPIVKWVGGKTRLLSQLVPLLPTGVERMRHIEPFLGGGALFFARRPGCSLLSDKNPHLCATYKAVRNDVEAVISRVRALAAFHGDRHYALQRARFNSGELDQVERAALFIYLNKTCYNGLYRENRRGEFNVPMGRYANPSILAEAQLRAAGRALKTAQLRCGLFEVVLELAQPGDFVYFDPPYVPISRTANFTAYAANGFTVEDQIRLRSVFEELDRRGCAVMLSNSATSVVRELYAGYRFDVVSTCRSISCATTRRGTVNEFVVRNYGDTRAELRESVPAARHACASLEACA